MKKEIVLYNVKNRELRVYMIKLGGKTSRTLRNAIRSR